MKAKLTLLIVAVLVTAGCPDRRDRTQGRRMAETWLVTYLEDTKVGYSVSRQDQLADGYRFESLMRMNVTMGGKTQDVRSFSEVVTGLDLTLQSFTFSFRSQDRSLSVSGQVQGKELVVEGTGDTPRTIPLDRAVYPMAALGQLVMRRRPAKDSVYRFPVFDVSVMSVMTVEVAVEGKERIKVGGEEVEGLKVKTRLGQVEMTSWLDENGMPLVELSPPRMRSVRTTPEKAMAMEGGQTRLDLLRMFRVPVVAVIDEPSRVCRARLEISGLDPGEFRFESDHQKMVSKSPFVLEITSPAAPERFSAPVAGQDEFVKASLTVQSDNEAIRRKALEVVGQQPDLVAAVRQLVSWVFTAVAKEPTASFPTALDVLRNMRGDCNEHAVFFAALARSLGIPTKLVAGLVYMDGAFYYHAWNEVFLGQWIPVDATFGEFPASALHLKLAEGELSEQTQILALVGRIGITLREWNLTNGK
ncbi:MAG: transglutaminase domain-containing protein [candidate division WOR-3 bacterium]